MNDLHKLARIMLVGLGIHMLVKYGIGFASVLPHLLYPESSMHAYAVVQLVSYALAIVCIGLVIYALIWKADFWSEKIMDADESDQAEVWWLPFAFRLAVVCAGILLLSWNISAVSKVVSRYVRAREYTGSNLLPWHTLVGCLAQLVLAIYLICGAPHFVRWQVRKTLEHCGRWEEPDDISDEEE